MNSNDRRLKDLLHSAESSVEDALISAFELGFEEGNEEGSADGFCSGREEGYNEAWSEWERVAELFGCYSPEELKDWYNNMLTNMAEVANERDQVVQD